MSSCTTFTCRRYEVFSNDESNIKPNPMSTTSKLFNPTQPNCCALSRLFVCLDDKISGIRSQFKPGACQPGRGAQFCSLTFIWFSWQISLISTFLADIIPKAFLPPTGFWLMSVSLSHLISNHFTARAVPGLLKGNNIFDKFQSRCWQNDNTETRLLMLFLFT